MRGPLRPVKVCALGDTAPSGSWRHMQCMPNSTRPVSVAFLRCVSVWSGSAVRSPVS